MSSFEFIIVVLSCNERIMSCRYTEIQYYSVLLYNVPVWLPLLLFSFLLVLASQWLELEGNIFNLNLLRKYWINMFYLVFCFWLTSKLVGIELKSWLPKTMRVANFCSGTVNVLNWLVKQLMMWIGSRLKYVHALSYAASHFMYYILFFEL